MAPGDFAWSDQRWPGIAMSDLVIYELHVGTFTISGSFDGVVKHLPALRDLGVSAIEIMPVAEFPGRRNWGYDGVHPYAPHSNYGGPLGLKRLVDAAHETGLAVRLFCDRVSTGDRSPHREMLHLYRSLLGLRRAEPALHPDSAEVQVEYSPSAEHSPEGWIAVRHYGRPGRELLTLFNVSRDKTAPDVTPVPQGGWSLLLSTAATEFGGRGKAGGITRSLELQPYEAAIYRVFATV